MIHTERVRLWWVCSFSAGHYLQKDAKYDENIDNIRHISKTYARLTIREIAQLSNISLAEINKIFITYLAVGKIKARWILHLLLKDLKHTGLKLEELLLNMYSLYMQI